MNVPRPLVVFDCNVLFQALARSTGPSAACLRLAEKNAITFFVSRLIVRELRLTLEYPEIRERNPHITDAGVKEFISRLLFRAVMVRSVPRAISLSRDPDDEPYLNLTVKVRADFLVTRDKDLLSLMTEHSIEAKEFRQRLPSVQILEPPNFLAAIAKI